MTWDANLAEADAVAAAYFDTIAFRLVPMREGVGPNAPRRAEEDRAVFDFMGSLDLNPPAVQSGFQQQAGGAGREGVQHEAVITAMATGWAWLPRALDRIEGLADGQAWQVAARPRNDHGRIVIAVARAKG